MKTIHCFLILVSSMAFLGCYSLKGTSIPADVNTFYVNEFEDISTGMVPTLSISFTEKLKNQIRTETRQILTDTDPDIEFAGTITDVKITSEAPIDGETTAFSRLTIVIKVEYISNKREEDNWNKSFSFLEDYGSDENFLEIQDDLVKNITDQIVQDIINKSFSNW